MRIALLAVVAFVPLARADEKAAEAAFKKAVAHAEKREHDKAVEAFTESIKADANTPLVFDRRGDSLLKLGKFTEAIADFDAYLKANPKHEPEHWRRGIAYYYAGKHKEGVKQFETHKTVNPQDVENAVWHYLCNAKVIGKEKAARELIDVTKDPRVPMAEIQKLYAGKLKPDDVMAAANKVDEKSEAGKEARFYGHLYVALWYEAEGDDKKVIEHLTPAVEKYVIGHYMWDVAKVHLAWTKAKKK
jgi:lipoprotein NlpI